MRVLWLNTFDFSGNTEAVINWGQGLCQKGLQLHLVLTGLPSSLLKIYEEFISKGGLKSSLNINRQQIQNLLYYGGFELLHVFHPRLFTLAAELGSSFRLPWLATVFEETPGHALGSLERASYITCCNSPSFQAVSDFLYPYNTKKLVLIPQGVKIREEIFPPLTELKILYVGPLEPGHLPAFQALNRVLRDLKLPPLGVFSRHNPCPSEVTFYPWSPDFKEICARYNVIASFGYYLLQGIAAGKIALIMEENYAGLFSPGQRSQVPDLRARGPANDDAADLKRLTFDLRTLQNRLPGAQKLQEENWNYARENHNVEIVAEKILRLYSRF